MLQSETILQVGADLAELPVIVPGARLRSVLADEVDREVDVIVSGRGQTVPDGDPAAWGFTAAPVETECPDDLVGGFAPLFVGELTFGVLEG